MQDSWHILGTGAIGTLWATKFLAQSIPCTLLQKNSAQPVPPNTDVNLKINHLDGSIENHCCSLQPIASPLKINQLLVCTKSYQTLDALAALTPYIADNASIVLLQNGMGQHELVARQFPQQHIFAATTSEGAMLESYLKVKHTGRGSSFFGSYQPSTPITAFVTHSLSKVGMQLTPDIQQILWRKLMVNCVINPLTAIHNCTNGELLQNPHCIEQVQALCNDVDKVTQALNFKDNQINTFAAVEQVAKLTARNYSSMHQDIHHQRPSEIMFINQYLQQQANQLGLTLDVNPDIIKKIHCLEQASTTCEHNHA